MMLIQWFVGGLGTSLSCGQFALANLLASQELDLVTCWTKLGVGWMPFLLLKKL